MSIPKWIDYSNKEWIEKADLNEESINESNNTRDLLLWMKGELDDNPRLYPKEIWGFEFITNKMFLEEYNLDERLKYVTIDNILPFELIDWTCSEVTFSFDLDWNWKINKELYLKTSAWQVLPEEVESVRIWKNVYSRNNLGWEFFDKNNKRLVIHHNTTIKIEKLRTIDEKNEIQKANDIKTKEYEKNKDSDIVIEAVKRWITIWLVFKLFSKLLSNISWIERNVELEVLFTQFDRIRGRWQYWENSEELKKYLINENTFRKLNNFTFNWDNTDFSNLWKWEKWLLDFISIAEWTNWNYNAIYWNWNQSSISFTDMTIKEILEYQKNYTNKWSYSSAIGKYQFIRQTLWEMINKYWIDINEKFSPELQDRLAILKMKEYWLNEFKNNWNTAVFQYKLSQIWASIPKDKSWHGYYESDWINHARVNSKNIQDQLQTFFL